MNQKLTKPNLKILFGVIFCLLIPWSVSAQSTTVTGRVMSTDSLPIPGASVKIKNTTQGISTAQDGTYSIKATGGSILVFSAVGYLQKEIKLAGNFTQNVYLEEDNQSLGEVVVVAYGKQKKLSLTGAISSVGTKELRQSPVANLSNALAGRLPGLTTMQNSGEPGYDGSQLWIRGMSTFSGSQTPLILVDGVERSFSGVDANEVESISILKDASSTAVFGVRGANGVVLVTTRRGKEGKPQISFSAQTGIQEPTRLPDYMDSFDALSLYKVGLINNGLSAATYTDEYLNKFRDRSKPAYEYLYPNVDWMNELLKSNAAMYQGNLNVSGGDKTVRYFTSISYLKQDGLYKYADLSDYNIQAVSNKYNFRSNIDINITKDLSMELNLGEIVYDNNYPTVSAGGLFADMQAIPPYLYPMKNPDGSVAYLPAKTYNPYGRLTQGGYQRNFSNSLQATAGFNLNMPFITKGLSVKARLSFDANSYRNVTRAKSYSTYQYSIADDQETDLSLGTYTRLAEGSNNLGYAVAANSDRRTQLEAYINYDRTFGQKHAITGMALYQQQSFFDDVGSNDAKNGLPYKYNGIIGRATYAYDGKYFGEVNFGYNGSENFPAGMRYDFFPAFSIGYLLSKEEFFANNVKFIDVLKIRASVGSVGNDKINGGRFLYQSTWNLAGTGYQFGRNRDGVYYAGTTEAASGNTLVTWEKAKKYNVGLDLELFKNTLSFTGDIFYEKRRDILTQPLTLPSSLGITSLPLLNLGITENKGFEVALEYRKQQLNYGYFVKGNFSLARNKILEMDEPSFAGHEYQRRTGNSINDQYGLKAIGLFQSQEEIQNSPSQSAFGNVQPGDIKYKDMNGDGIISNLDAGYLGKSSTPEKILGAAFGFNIKNFDVSVLFQGAFGGNVWFTGPRIWAFSGDSGVLQDLKDNYWTPENPNAKYPRISSAANANNNQYSDYWVYSTDYIRLKNVEVGYTLPKSFMKKIGINNARIFVNGLNLVTWDNIKIFDPESPNDSGNYPQQRVFNGGISFTL